MKRLTTLFTLMAFMASSIVIYADTYDPATNLLVIPSVQDGTATYSNVVVNLGIDYQVTTGYSIGGPITTIDNYDAVNKLLTIPIVSVVGSRSYYNATVQLGNTFQIVSVGKCTGCSNSGGVESGPPLENGIGVGAGTGVSPTLTNPVNAVSNGAIGDGATDNTAAFQRALAVGDLFIPPGNYVVNGSVEVPAGRNIQCASTDSVNIINPALTYGNETFQLSSGASLSNCTLSGADDFYSNGAATYSISPQVFNFLVAVVDWYGPVSNVTIVNNVFKNCHGNSCVAVYGSNVADVSNITVSNNTFNNCGYYSVALDAVTDSVVAHNAVTDCAMGIEQDLVEQVPSRNNVFDGNYLTAVHGNGVMVTNGGKAPYNLFLTGGIATDSDYSSNIVQNNTVMGSGTPDSIEIIQNATHPAQYINNTCSNGCLVRP